MWNATAQLSEARQAARSIASQAQNPVQSIDVRDVDALMRSGLFVRASQPARRRPRGVWGLPIADVAAVGCLILMPASVARASY